jgi:hypothetical protein
VPACGARAARTYLRQWLGRGPPGRRARLLGRHPPGRASGQVGFPERDGRCLLWVEASFPPPSTDTAVRQKKPLPCISLHPWNESRFNRRAIGLVACRPASLPCVPERAHQVSVLRHVTDALLGGTERFTPDEAEPIMSQWIHCVETGADWDYEHHVLGPDGRYPDGPVARAAGVWCSLCQEACETSRSVRAFVLTRRDVAWLTSPMSAQGTQGARVRTSALICEAASPIS